MGLATAIVIFLANQHPPAQAQTLNSDQLPLITKAISQVPDRDVAGSDPDGLVRPKGSVRSYYTQKGNVITLVYVQHGDPATVREELRPSLAAKGWQTINDATPSPSPGFVTEATWTALFGRGGEGLQVNILQNESVVATTYILQVAR